MEVRKAVGIDLPLPDGCRFGHSGTSKGFISIRTTSQGVTNLSCPLPHCFQVFERALMEKLLFSQKCHLFASTEVSFQPKTLHWGENAPT